METENNIDFDKQPGDTYPGEAIIQPFPDGEPGHPAPHVRVTIPWKTQRSPDTAVFARTLYVYWNNDALHGVASTFQPRAFRVTLDNQHQVLAHLSGKMRKNFVRLTVGDRVRMEMSPYDLSKARITYRMK